MSSVRVRVAGSRLAIAAGFIGLLVTGGYLAIIVSEDNGNAERVGVVSVFLLATSVLALVGGFAFSSSPRVKLVVLGAATGGFITAGFVGMFSIGLPLLVAGMLCGVAWARVAEAVRPAPAGAPILSVLAAIAMGALLVFGIAST